LIKYTQNPRHKLPWVEYARQARLNIPCKPGLAMVVDVPGKAEELQAVLRGLSFGRKIASVRGNCAFFGTVATPNHQSIVIMAMGKRVGRIFCPPVQIWNHPKSGNPFFQALFV
jgi:hypothetical protein